ncbi:carotenoid oxygenase [Rhexocercosporidium sp. MPI-PUGE-AT-0058]|nr:carotenoid oxygenase [Rhexocercosporidium sp. MPI-PUGE-AT-0058]
MAAAQVQDASKAYNNYWVGQKDLKYVPPYLRDVPETPNQCTCVTQGQWPAWLKGSFMRIGAGKFVVPLSEDGSKPPAILQHFFDGLGILHKFIFENGKVRYISRHTAEGVIRRAKKEGFLSVTMFGLNANTPLQDAQDPCSALLGAQQSLWVPNGYLEPDAANVNVVPRRGMHLPKDKNPLSRGSASEKPEEEEVMVFTDFNLLQVCDATTLEPKRLLTYADIDAELSGFGICAHPPKDRKLGTIYNYLISKEGGLFVFALDIKASPVKLLWKTALPCPPCYIHSLAMTQDYVVFIRNPLHMNTSDMTKQVMEMIEYEEGVTTKFLVMRKSDGKHIATYEAPNFMFFHSVNAYDYINDSTGDINVHVDLCSYKGDYVPYREYNLSNVLDPVRPFMDGTLVRYELSAVNKADDSSIERATVAQAIPGVAMELPRIRKDMSMVVGYRYVYACAGNGGSSPGTEVPIGRYGAGLKTVQAAFFGSIAKSDWLTGNFIRWQPGDGESCPCEPVFVARPGSTEEDDGLVLTIVIDRKGTKSILVALDGKTLKEVARADMPQVYALGPHGSFIESADM